MYSLGFLFALCFCNVISYKVNLDSKEFEEWRRGVPEPAPTKATSTGKCIIDLVILLDASWSIGEKTFNENVKPFLRNLTSHLDVAPDRTRIAFVIFREKDHTKYILEFANRTREEYETFINKLTYVSKFGHYTYTGKALKIVDKKIFTKNNPQNIRTNVKDVVLLITDGEPHGHKTEKNENNEDVNKQLIKARNHSKSLKQKDILIVGVAVGKQKSKFRSVIEELSTSKNTTFDSDFDSLNDIVDQIVSASCIEPVSRALCSCSSIQSNTEYIVPPATTVDVSWPSPTFQCGNNTIPKHTTTINPNIVAPHSFSVGHHPIEYTYTFSGGSLKCYVNITVKSCKCPNTALINKDLEPGKTTATVEWKKPEPNCPHTLIGVSPSEANSGKMNFGLGEHDITYNYHIKNSPTACSLLKCQLKIKVGGKVCGEVGMSSAQVCCCGKAYDSKPNHECCGYRYYDKSNKKCVGSYTLVHLSRHK